MFDLEGFFAGLKPKSLAPFAAEKRCVFLSWPAAMAAFRAGLVSEEMLEYGLFYCGIGATRQEFWQLSLPGANLNHETFLPRFVRAVTVAETKGNVCWKTYTHDASFIHNLNQFLMSCGLAALKSERYFTVEHLANAAAEQNLQIISMNFFSGTSASA